MLVPFRPNEATREAPQSSGTRIPSSYRESVENRSLTGRRPLSTLVQWLCPPTPLGPALGQSKIKFELLFRRFPARFPGRSTIRRGEEIVERGRSRGLIEEA